MELFDLSGKVAVITGAGSGMGRASVEVFVREGAQVVGADVSGAEEETAAALGDAVVPVHCDVTSEAEVEALIAGGKHRIDYEVIPGITAVQALAARHKIPLNRIAEPVLVERPIDESDKGARIGRPVETILHIL